MLTINIHSTNQTVRLLAAVIGTLVKFDLKMLLTPTCRSSENAEIPFENDDIARELWF